jgi:hypothetical protein
LLRIRLHRDDLVGSWRLTNGRFLGAKSVLEPFLHPALESQIFTGPHGFALIVRERGSGSLGPLLSHETFEDIAALDRIVAEARTWPLEHLVLAVALDCKRNPTVTLWAGEWGTAPLYIVSNDDELIADWDPASLYPEVRNVFDLGRLAYSLAFLGLPYSRRTLFPRIQMLTERAVATWDAKEGLSVRYPPAKPIHAARDLVPEADVLGSFEQLFSAVVKRWLPDEDGKAASELSGGLDSGVATAILARGCPEITVHTFGLIMPGLAGPGQRARRNEIIEKFEVSDLAIDACDFPPLGIAGGGPEGVIPWGEIYYEAFAKLLCSAKAKGCRAIVRGLGGDEISGMTLAELGLSESPQVLPTAEVFDEPRPSFLTRKGIELAQDASKRLDPAPSGAAARSFYESVAASSPLFLRSGVWPLHPYGAPEVVAFCRSLPAAWRRDRSLQRRLLRSYGLSERVVRPDPPESFWPLRDLAMQGKARESVHRLMSNSALADLGIIDPRRFSSSYNAYCEGGSADESDNLLQTILLEATLQSLT